LNWGLEDINAPLARRAGSPVPAVAPDTIPAWVFADSNVVSDSVQSAAAFYANVIEVKFVPGASQANRQTAIDAVGGEVVGGESLPAGGEGAYFVRIAAGRQIDPLREAARALRAMPQVDGAAPLYGTAEKFLRPNDDDADYRTWAIDPDPAGTAPVPRLRRYG
jgi:hypothetical protein